MLTIDSRKPIDLDLYERRINSLGFVYVDTEAYRSKVYGFSAEELSLSHLLITKILIYSNDNILGLDGRGNNVQDLLISLGINSNRFILKGKYGKQDTYSMNKDAILYPLLDDLKSGRYSIGENTDTAIEVLECYIKYTKTKSEASGIKKISNWEPTDVKTESGRKLAKAGFTYKLSNTFRHYTNNDSIQNWNLKLVETITTEKDWFLVSIDLKQVDLRVALNLMIRSQENAAIFEKYDDKYEALVRAIYVTLGKLFDNKVFKEQRDIYKMLALAKLYKASNSKLGRRGAEAEVISLLDQFYSRSTKYKAYSDTAELYISNELDCDVTDYFGAVRTIYHDDDNPISKYCNTYVQSTSASIIKAVTNSIIDRFVELGHNENLIIAYLNRHDETLFKLHKSLLKDIWVFKDYEKIYVDDWDVLGLDVHIYDYYKVEDEKHKEYMAYYEKCWKDVLGENLERQTPRQNTEGKLGSYFPIETAYMIIRSPLTKKEVLKYFIQSMNIFANETYQGMTLDEYVDWLDKDDKLLAEFCKDKPIILETCTIADRTLGSTYVVDLSRGIGYKSTNWIDLDILFNKTHRANVFILNGTKEDKQVTSTNVIFKHTQLPSTYEIINDLEKEIKVCDKFHRVNTTRLYSIAKSKS